MSVRHGASASIGEPRMSSDGKVPAGSLIARPDEPAVATAAATVSSSNTGAVPISAAPTDAAAEDGRAVAAAPVVKRKIVIPGDAASALERLMAGLQ